MPWNIGSAVYRFKASVKHVDLSFKLWVNRPEFARLLTSSHFTCQWFYCHLSIYHIPIAWEDTVYVFGKCESKYRFTKEWVFILLPCFTKFVGYHIVGVYGMNRGCGRGYLVVLGRYIRDFNCLIFKQNWIIAILNISNANARWLYR